ncbi:hypothetical protein, partial [Sutcliffiella cohnii]|uniref:hypothetical protein n=1 Tax=Sutcliffiella cohnii TaxID=33932 RepID=UPI001C3F4D78
MQKEQCEDIALLLNGCFGLRFLVIQFFICDSMLFICGSTILFAINHFHLRWHDFICDKPFLFAVARFY